MPVIPPRDPDMMQEQAEGQQPTDEEMLETVRQGMGGQMNMAQGQKMSQEEANYRQGTDQEHCSICQHYEGGDQCAVVQSPIAPDGLSDEFVAQNQGG